MEFIDKTKPVLVTGATGYVAGRLVEKLLKEGLIVHAAVRNPRDLKKLRFLDEAASKYSGTIQYFASDLLKPGSYEAGMKHCELVFHIASPFTLSVNDPQKDLVEPAQLGTRNVLESANKTESVKRVVVTSSCASIYGDNIDLLETPSKCFTEDVWNTSSSLEHQAYSFSKTLAEKEAWRISESQSRWDLVVVNPSFVIGSGLNPEGTSESFRVFQQFGDGAMKAGVPDYGIGCVDVNDVAKAHFRAGFSKRAKGRYIVSGHNSSFPEIAGILRENFENYPFPQRVLPKWLVWLVGPIADKNMTRKLISRNVGYPFVADNSKSVNDLKINYRTLEESVCSFFQQMIDSKKV